MFQIILKLLKGEVLFPGQLLKIHFAEPHNKLPVRIPEGKPTARSKLRDLVTGNLVFLFIFRSLGTLRVMGTAEVNCKFRLPAFYLARHWVTCGFNSLRSFISSAVTTLRLAKVLRISFYLRQSCPVLPIFPEPYFLVFEVDL